jgi:hypothetical protein
MLDHGVPRTTAGLVSHEVTLGSGRNFRTTDTWNAALDLAIEQMERHILQVELVTKPMLARCYEVRDNGGLLLDENGDPLALKVNTAQFPGSHFATFPCDLVLPFVRAGSSEKGVCPACRTPWERVVEHKTATPGQAPGYNRDSGARNDGDRAGSWTDMQSQTLGWRPTCECNAEPVPALVLDPFSGAGTTLMVSDRERRDAIGIELSPEYAQMSRERIEDDGGMFTQVEIE